MKGLIQAGTQELGWKDVPLGIQDLVISVQDLRRHFASFPASLEAGDWGGPKLRRYRH